MKKMMIIMMVVVLFLSSCAYSNLNDNSIESNAVETVVGDEVIDNNTVVKIDEVNNLSLSKDEDRVINFDIISEMSEVLDGFGYVIIKVGTFREINGLVVMLYGEDGNEIYITPSELRNYGDCGVEVRDIYIGDVNGDELDDITIIFSSYLGAGYLGGLEFDRSYVLLQSQGSFVFDNKQYEIANEVHINTAYENVKFYYDIHDWNKDLYTIEKVNKNIENEYVNISAEYPHIKSDYAGLESHTNDMIDYYIDSFLYDFNFVEDFTTVNISYEILDKGRYLNIKCNLDYQKNGGEKINEIFALKIDLETGARIYNLETSLDS